MLPEAKNESRQSIGCSRSFYLILYLTLTNYRKNDYAANKYSPNIVYRFNDEIIEISLEDYLEENPDRTEQDFLKLKALSDEIYYEQDRAENTQTRKNISIQGMEEMNCCATRSLEDEWEEFEVERQNYRYAKLALGQLFTTNILTETQKRRFRLNIFYGLSSREIGRIEGASHQAVAKSLKIAVEKLRVIFAEQG